jgi:hypothetical protein
VTGRRRLLLTLHVSSAGATIGAIVLTLALLLGAGVGTAVPVLGTLCVYGVLVPLLVAGLLTGLVSALTSPWGLFRHGWVVKKLCLTLLAVVVGSAVVGPAMAGPHVSGRADWPLFAGLAVLLALLLLTTTLSVFKPKGRRVPT